MNRFRSVLSLFIWYLPVLAVQIASSQVTITSIGPWYQELNKASWNPPPWVFGPVWTLLYLMMAISVWIVYRNGGTTKQRFWAFTLFFIQLAVNGLWSFLFFGYQLLGWAFLDLAALTLLVAVTAFLFYRLRPLAGVLMVPYLLWTSYALTLNGAIWWLNS